MDSAYKELINIIEDVDGTEESLNEADRRINELERVNNSGNEANCNRRRNRQDQ